MAVVVLLGSLVGLSLALTGGGGSIFAVPLLVYGLKLSFREAVTLSLAIVGATALYGALLQARRGNVLWGAGAVLGLGGIISAPFGAALGSQIPDRLSIILFAAIMVTIGGQILRERPRSSLAGIECQRDERGAISFSWPCATKLLIAGSLTGILSGVFGVGGGFLLVPTLLVVGGITIESAMATSLVAITLISASGFLSNLGNISNASLPLAVEFLGGALAEMTIGSGIKHHLPARVLRRIFGVAIIVTAAALVASTIVR